MNQNDCSGKTLKRWPVLVDHYTIYTIKNLSASFTSLVIHTYYMVIFITIGNNMRLLKQLLPVIITSLLLNACSSQQTSVDKNARHAVSRVAKIHFDPNSRLQTADSIKVMKPLLQQFYDQGKKDHSDGLTLAQARQRAENFKCPGVITSSEKTTILGQTFEADEPAKQSQIVLDTAITTYWDGYNGRP